MRRLYKILVCYLFILFFSSLTMNSQNFKGERRIYFLDATFSLITNKVDNTTLWDQSKKNLIKAIQNIDDEETEIVVIVFADDKKSDNAEWKRYEVKATDEGKKKIIKQIQGLNAHGKTSMTNLGKPIRHFIEKEAKPDKINYMFLLTDGAHEQGEAPQNVIKQSWDSTSPLTFGFHVELIELNNTPSSQALKAEINKHDRIWTVQSADVDLNLIRLENKAIMNLRNENSIEIPIYFQGKDPNVTDKITVTFDDPEINMQDFQIRDNKLILNLSPKIDLSSLPDKKNVKVNLSLPPTGKTFLLTPSIDLQILNKKERVLNISKTRIKGKSEQYDAFLWSGAQNIPYEIKIPLNFSKDAKADSDTFAEFEFLDEAKNYIDTENMLITVNGKPYNGTFHINPNDTELNLTFSFPKDAKEGKYAGTIRLKKHHLDRINQSILTQEKNPEVIEYKISNSHSLNPLAWVFIWIGVAILTALVIWFFIVKPIKYKTFKNFPKTILVKQNGQIVAQFNVNFKGARKVVISNQRFNQSFLNRVFTGKIKMVVNPYFKSALTFIPLKRDAAIYGNGYSANPRIIPRNGRALITHIQEKLQISL